MISDTQLIWLFTLLVFPLGPSTVAQDALKPGLDSITEVKVRETVSFLASDEMAGRDTPSPELRKAAEYVAERFKKAGLKPGVKESYFQITQIATTELDNGSVVLRSGGKDVKNYGLLGAGQESFSYQGRVLAGDPEDKSKRYDGPVSYTAPRIESPADELQVSRMIGRLKRRGATAVLIEVADDSRLIATAARSGLPRIINPRGKFSVPTLLVSGIEPDAEYEIKIPAVKHGKTDVRNVIGVVPGSDPESADEAIIFSAHLDHIGRQDGLKDPVFNGADDNATGVTAVLALADAYAALPTAPKRSVIFMTFWGEEKGLLGSRYYANHPTWPLKKTIANINLEMVGRPQPGARGKCWMTGWNHSDLGTLMAAGAKQVGVEIFEHPQFSNMLYRASDNASFVDKGVIGHSFSAGSLHDDYHKPGDEWEKLEIKHMTKVIRGLFAGSYKIASAEVTPTKSEQRR